MKTFFKIALIVCILLSVVYAEQQNTNTDSTSVDYANGLSAEFVGDTPWILSLNDTIPLFFIIHGYVFEFHCMAVYDITDGVKHYNNGTRYTPELNQTWIYAPGLDTLAIDYPPLEPSPLVPDSVPNQIYYWDFTDSSLTAPFELDVGLWKREANKFNHIGGNYNQSLNGTPITPANLGYSEGDTITLSIVMIAALGRAMEWNPPNPPQYWYEIVRHHTQDLKILVSNGLFTKLPNWYLADCHSHTWNTGGSFWEDPYEFGGPTPYMAKAAKKIGLDCMITTDHSNDCGWIVDHNDAFGTSGNNWEHCGWEVDQYTEYALLIRGEEISSRKQNNHKGPVICHLPWVERHWLGFGIESYIEGWHPLLPGYPGLIYNMEEILSGGPPPDFGNNPPNNIRAQNGFAYYAHPADYIDSTIIWYTEGGIPKDTLISDTISLWMCLEHPVCKGWQIFNCQKTYKSDDEFHPWNPPESDNWEESHPDWFKDYEKALPFWDKILSNFIETDHWRKKVFILGGSDAHGALNYSQGGGACFYAWFADATALGNWHTGVFSPNGLTEDNILNGIKNGRTVVSNGPFAIFGIDMNEDGDLDDSEDIIIGDGDDNEDGMIDYKTRLFDKNLRFHFQYISNQVFREVDTLIFFRGSGTTAEFPEKIYRYPNNFGGYANITLDPLNPTEPTIATYYFRTYIHCLNNYDNVHKYCCFTNPIWLEVYAGFAPNNLACDVADEEFVRISWEWDGPIMFDHFSVLRKLKNTSTWDTVGTVYWGYRTFEDTIIARDTVYYYKMIAQKGITYSDESNTIEVRTPLINRPGPHIYAYATGANRIEVSFPDHSQIEDYFEIWRKGAGEGWHVHAQAAQYPVTGTVEFVDSNDVLPCSTYWYKIKAHTSDPPAGFSAATYTGWTTTLPYLQTSRDSTTAFQPKMAYDSDNGIYHMTYAAESLVLAAQSTDGLNWKNISAPGYHGQAGVYFWKAGFAQIDINESGIPSLVFSESSRKQWNPNPLWYRSIVAAKFDPQTNEWVDVDNIFTLNHHHDEEPPFIPFTFVAKGDTVHIVFADGEDVKWRWYDFNNISSIVDLGDFTFAVGDSNRLYPAMCKDPEGNLHLAWYSGDYDPTGYGPMMNYRERTPSGWSSLEQFKILMDTLSGYDQGVSCVSIKHYDGKPHLLSSIQDWHVAYGWMNPEGLVLSVRDGTWQSEWVISDTTATNGQLLSENLVVYSLEVNNDFDIYYQERTGTGWSDPQLVRNTSESSRFPQGVFDGEAICLVWTEGDEAPFTVDTAKIHVLPSVEITHPTPQSVLGGQLRAGLPVNITWTSSDNIGVTLHRVYYGLGDSGEGIDYTQIGSDLPGTTHELNWTVLDTTVSNLWFKVEAVDGAGMLRANEVGSFKVVRELVYNPNFEEVYANQPYLWSTYGTGDVFESDWDVTQNGQFSAHIGRTTSSNHFGFFQDKIPVQPNTTYWLNGFIKTQSTAGQANLAFGVWHAHPDTNHHSDFGNVSGNTEWVYVCDSITTRPYEDTIKVLIYGNPDFVGDAWFDNLTLEVDSTPPTVVVSYPNGGEQFLVEQPITIYWYATDNVQLGKIDSVKYTPDAGQNWYTIATDLPPTAISCEWTVPEYSNQYLIRVVVSDASGNTASDESDDYFGFTYFTLSGFEDWDPACLQNIVSNSHGISNPQSGRVTATPEVTPHSGSYMYKITGTDSNPSTNSYAIFKVFPYDFIITDTTYFSFWMYIKDAPTDSGHICMDVYTKSGKVLRDWDRFGKILDQTGQEIHPAIHKAPKDEWCQYVFSFSPADKETVDCMQLIYDDDAASETGYFEAYIDEIMVLDTFPIPNCWHAEIYPNDTNATIDFELGECGGVTLILYNNGTSGEQPDTGWGRAPYLRNNIDDIEINSFSRIYWQQWDKNHALLYSLLIEEEGGEDATNWLTYAENGNNHWYKQGWVDMGTGTREYNKWEGFSRSIWQDYYDEYGAYPKKIKELRCGHFSKHNWTGDNGGTIYNPRFYGDTVVFDSTDFSSSSLPLENCLEDHKPWTVSRDSASIFPLEQQDEYYYKVKGEDICADSNTFCSWRIFDENIPIEGTTYLKFSIMSTTSPQNEGHLFLDGKTKGGHWLRGYFHGYYGWLIDQYGTRIHPAVHTLPRDQWSDYVFNLSALAGDTIDYLLVSYEDDQSSETGEFRVYLDDIQVFDQYPWKDYWYAEIFGSDTNAVLQCIAVDDSVKLVIDNNGGLMQGWCDHHPILRNDITDKNINSNTRISWSQYDKDYSLILSLLISDANTDDRWLIYARNALDRWSEVGWVDMNEKNPAYNVWESFQRNILTDYRAEYGLEATPLAVKELRIEHFARKEWNGDHGGTVRSLLLSDGDPERMLVTTPNGAEKYEIGELHPISWDLDNSFIPEKLQITYSTDGGNKWRDVIRNNQNDRRIKIQAEKTQFLWRIPSSPSDKCLVRISAHDKEERSISDISDNPFSICWLTSQDRNATAGQGRLVFDREKIHVVFTSQENIYHSYSKDNGKTWEKKKLLAHGTHPELAIDTQGNLHLIYCEDNTIWYELLDSDLKPARCYSVDRGRLSNHSLTIRGGYGYFLCEKIDLEAEDILVMVSFSLENPAETSTNPIPKTHGPFLKPYLAIEGDNAAHIAYTQNGSIYYSSGTLQKEKKRNTNDSKDKNIDHPHLNKDRRNHRIFPEDGMSRNEERDLSQTISWTFDEPKEIGQGSNVKMSLEPEGLVFVWENEGDIFRRKRPINTYLGEIENISHSQLRTSKDPVILSFDCVAWLEGSESTDCTRHDVFVSIQDGQVQEKRLLIKNSEPCYNLHALSMDELIYCAYTRGNDNSYEVKAVVTRLYNTSMTITTEPTDDAESPNSEILIPSINFGLNPTKALTVNYIIDRRQRVDIAVYDIAGRLVAKEEGMKESGFHHFGLKNLSSGIYFIQFKADVLKETRKVIVTK